MPALPDKIKCCGCGACSQICPGKAITMVPDSEGFPYPSVDADKCVRCSLCERACPVLDPFESKEPLGTYAMINPDDKVRLSSSSGGVFYALADEVIRSGGVVFGACYDRKWQVIQKSADSIRDIASFMGSKYMQSDTCETFAECEKFLKAGRMVLYSGTPCLIAGLNRFLRRDYESLLTVDVICHGVPSPKVWKKYLENIAGDVCNVMSVNMRDKHDGWADYSIAIDYCKDGNNHQYRSPFRGDRFMQAFLKDMILRPSCHNCSFKGLRSGSDISIGDFWGVDSVMPEINDGKGVSLVLINTEKGKQAMEGLDINASQTTFEDGVRGNSAIVRSPEPWPRRSYFFSKLDSCEDVSELIIDSLTLPLGIKSKMKNLIKSVLGMKYYSALRKCMRHLNREHGCSDIE